MTLDPNLPRKFSSIANFAFKGEDRTFIRLSNNAEAYWENQTKWGLGFSKKSSKTGINHLTNVSMKHRICMPMGINPASFLANIFLYSYEEEYKLSLIFLNKIKARHFHLTKGFIHHLYTLNDGWKFGRAISDIYPKKLKLKGNHATLLNLDTSIKEESFKYKLFDKRDCFPFSVVKMLHIERNIPQNSFYSKVSYW